MVDVKFVLICKTCKQAVDPEKLIEHTLSHPPTAYYDSMPVVTEWPTPAKRKPNKK